MGKLIYSLNVSLDGFAETPDHSLDWAAVDEEVHAWFNDQARTMDATLYGRRMYELMAGYWPAGEDDPPFWPELDNPLRLRLVEKRTFASGVELRSYVPV